MDSKNEARIIQNLIDEAEENYAKIIEALAHPRNNAQIAQRRKDIDEGIALVGELNAPEAPRDELIGTIRGYLTKRRPDQMTTAWGEYQDALAALDRLAAQKPKVPMAMLKAMAYQGIHTMGWMTDCAARYGVEVE
jgi:hypothetical protein